jgi:hypothetical protein
MGLLIAALSASLLTPPGPSTSIFFHSDRQLTAFCTDIFVGIKKYQPF